MAARATRAEIDLAAVDSNVEIVRRIAGTAVYGVVKADAYGHGAVRVAERLVGCGIDGLCVALVEEGLALRAASITCPILVLNGIYGHAHREVVTAALTPVVFDVADIEAFARATDGAPFGVHLKLDTGMMRLGVGEDELDGFLDELAVRGGGVQIEGLMTHLASAESDREKSAQQIARFKRCRERIEARGHHPKMGHVANSAGALLLEDARFDMVRAGVSLYGVSPRPDVHVGLKPVMRLVSSVVRVAKVRPGATVGYGGAWTAERQSRIATIALGYGDGVHRRSANGGEVLIGGVRCPIVGAVSMDLLTVDVTDAQCKHGDEVVVFGDASYTAEDAARAAGTIAYEVLTSVSPRVPRIYLG